MNKAWAAGGGPDDETLKNLVEGEGLTDKQIGEMYGVEEATVRYYRRRAGLVKADRPSRIDHRADGAIPWELNTALAHHIDPIARLLRSRNRRRRGEYVPADVSRRIDRFEADLAAEGLVIDYDRETGFMTRSRDPEIDAPDSIVRVPPTPSD